MLYYLTERHRSPHRTIANLYGYTPTQSSSTGSVSAPTAFSTAVTDLLSLSPSEALWRSLNPAGWPSVLLSVPPASLVVVPTPGHAMLPADLRKLSVKTSRLPLPRLRPLLYLLKVLVLPQAVTAGLLYILLLYLLKDADLLDAQRNRLGRGEVAPDEDMDSSTGLPSITSRGRSQLAANLGVHMLPCSHAADLDLIASSKDGALVMSVGIDNTLCLWRFTDDGSVSGTRETLSAEGLRTSDPVVAALVGSDGRDLAVCTVSGTVQRWTISEEGAVVAPPATNIPVQARIVGFTFDDSSTTSFDDPFMARPVSPATSPTAPTLLVACGNGEVFAVDATGVVSTIIPALNSSTCKAFFLAANPGADVSLNIVVATAERVDCFRKTSAGWTSYGIQATLDASDRITSADRLVIGDAATTFLALGHRSGFVEIFDSEGSLLVTTDVVGEPIRSVRLSSPASSKCLGCAATLNEGLFVISSTASHVYVDRVHPRSAPICRCPQPRRSSSIEDLAHRDGATPSKVALSGSGPGLVVPPTSIRRSSPGNSPRKSPGLLPPVSNGEFPLSSHGTRRLSTMHRDDMSPRPPSPGERSPAMLFTPTTGHGHGHGGIGAASSGPASWTDLEVTAMGGVRCTSGGAVLLGNHLDKVVGLRRFGSGIDEAGWQVWTLDLCSPWNGTMLVVERAPLDWLVRRTLTHRPTLSGSAKSANEGETSMRDRRAERLLGLSGRASFTSQPQTSFGGGGGAGAGGGSASGSFAVPTHPGLAYVQVHPIVSRDPTSLVAGFGNRLGLVVLPESSGKDKDKSKFGSLQKTSGVSAATATTATTATSATTAPAASAVTAATATGGGGAAISMTRRSVGGLGIGGVQNAGTSGTQGITPPPPARRSLGDLHLQVKTSDPPVSPVMPIGRTPGVGTGPVASNTSSNGMDRKNI